MGDPAATREGAFGDLMDAIERKHFEGRQVDWGSWVAAAKKEEIAAFVDELYGGEAAPRGVFTRV